MIELKNMKEEIFLWRNLIEKLFTNKRNKDTRYRMDIVSKKIIKRLIVVKTDNLRIT